MKLRMLQQVKVVKRRIRRARSIERVPERVELQRRGARAPARQRRQLAHLLHSGSCERTTSAR
eukprot:2721510-Prymnesium_polylepis.1